MWDPLGEYLVSQSADRSVVVCRVVYEGGQVSGLELVNKIVKCELPRRKEGELVGPGPGSGERPGLDFESSRVGFLFHNETLPSFFRRLCMSPCGSLLCVPAGIQAQPQVPAQSQAQPQALSHRPRLLQISKFLLVHPKLPHNCLILLPQQQQPVIPACSQDIAMFVEPTNVHRLYAEKGGHRRGGTIQGAVEARIEARKEGLEAVKEQRVGAPRWRGVYACG